MRRACILAMQDVLNNLWLDLYEAWTGNKPRLRREAAYPDASVDQRHVNR